MWNQFQVAAIAVERYSSIGQIRPLYSMSHYSIYLFFIDMTDSWTTRKIKFENEENDMI